MHHDAVWCRRKPLRPGRTALQTMNRCVISGLTVEISQRGGGHMGEYFVMLVDVDAKIDEADELAERVLCRFRDLEVVAGEANPDCVLDGVGYLPGPALSEVYQRGEDEFRFWESRSSGVQARVSREFNYWALSPCCDGTACPKRNTEFEQDDDRLVDQLFEACGNWAAQSGPMLVSCPECGEIVLVTEWVCRPTLGFGNLAFTSSGWPGVDAPE
jgi:hypothetical protein